MEYAEIKPVAVPCDMCGATESSLFLRVSNRGEMDNRDLVKCSSCGLVYVSPRKFPPYEDMDVDTIYYDALEGITSFKFYYDEISKWSPTPGRMLDVGCAAGYLLDVARAHGWNTVGLELGRGFIKVAKKYMKLDVREGTIFDYKGDDASFDVVAMTEVIEHVESPSKLLAEANRLLVSGGVIFMTTPNLGSKNFDKLGEKWTPQIEPFGHLYYFTADSLKRIMEKHGFTPLHVFTVGGDHEDDQLIAVGAKNAGAAELDKAGKIIAGRDMASGFVRLRRHWLFGAIIKLGNHLVNYPAEAKRFARAGLVKDEERFARLSQHPVFGPLIRLGMKIVS